MKMLSLPKGLTKSHSERLILAFAFLNTRCLYRPECSFCNSDYKGSNRPGFMFGDDFFSATYTRDNKNMLPAWNEFYEKHKNDGKSLFTCVAGCDENDKNRITLTFFPDEMAKALPAEMRDVIPVSVSTEVEDRKINKIINEIVKEYTTYKSIYNYDKE